jgi:hypothetical protein
MRRPAPVAVLHEQPAENRSQQGTEQLGDADNAEHAPEAPGSGRPGQQRHADRHDHPAAESLQHSERDQAVD